MRWEAGAVAKQSQCDTVDENDFSKQGFKQSVLVVSAQYMFKKGTKDIIALKLRWGLNKELEKLSESSNLRQPTLFPTLGFFSCSGS